MAVQHQRATGAKDVAVEERLLGTAEREEEEEEMEVAVAVVVVAEAVKEAAVGGVVAVEVMEAMVLQAVR